MIRLPNSDDACHGAFHRACRGAFHGAWCGFDGNLICDM
jgi:hypothetical protein